MSSRLPQWHCIIADLARPANHNQYAILKVKMVLVTKKKPAAPLHHKRRHGQHHKQDKRYSHTYWPYLPLAIIVGLGIVLNTFWATVQQAVLGQATDTSISGLLQETNTQRVANSVGGLALNAQLNQAAQAKANDMASRNYWSHNTPEGTPPWTFISQAGYAYYTAGENLAYGFDNSASTVAGWMGSPAHKENLLNSAFKEVGFGIANAEDYQSNGPQTIVVAMYGSVAPATSPAPAPQPTTPTPAPAPTPTPTPIEPAPETAQEEAEPDTDDTLATTGGAPTGPQAPETQQVARIELLTSGNAEWSMFAVTVVTAAAAAIFFFKHGLLWRRVILKGETFVHKHPFMDVALVSLAVIGFILTRSDGIIR